MNTPTPAPRPLGIVGINRNVYVDDTPAPAPIVKGTRVTVDPKWSHVDGYAPAGRVTRLIPGHFGSASVRLDSGKLCNFPVADLTVEGGTR